MSNLAKSFDDWLKEQNQPASNFLRRETYEAGQQSRQKEIDELKKQLALVLDTYYETDYFEEGVCVTAENTLNDKKRLENSWYLRYVKGVQE